MKLRINDRYLDNLWAIDLDILNWAESECIVVFIKAHRHH